MRLFEIASWNRISMYGASLIIASSVAYSCNSPGIHESTTHSPNAVNAAPKVTTSSRPHSTNSSSVLTPPSPGFTIHKAVDVPNGMVSAQIQIGNPPFFVTVPDETPSDEIVSQTQRSMRCLRPEKLILSHLIIGHSEPPWVYWKHFLFLSNSRHCRMQSSLSKYLLCLKWKK